jgi:TP901 family phage tail tape measure protein
MIKLDAVINDKKLLASIQKGVSQFNRSASGRSKLNLKINEKGFRQPLGRITGDLDKFESALAASNARVIAFGASTAVIGGITKAFKELATTTIRVQKAFIDINRILSVSNAQFDKFSTELFNIGKRTATTFEDSSKAALEFARQGLGLNETLKRTADALTLVRLTGVNADKAVSSLTAAVNAFQHTSISTTEVLNKFVAVETKFAVSAKDLMEGLGRVGSAAVDAKVSFNELNAMIAAVQQQTGRGGAVIGNAMKTIFTRLQRSETLEALEAYGVAVRDVEGSTRPAMDILQDFAKTYKTLSDANRAYLREQVAGVFQANILSAVVKDLNSNMQVYGRALETSKGATNQAAMANAKLNQSISALISQTGTELVRLQENIGKVTFEPIAKAILGPFKGILESINNVIDGEGLGSDLANGVLKGIRNVLAGPGLVSAIAVIGITFFKTLSYITKALPTLVGITSETQKRASLEASIVSMMSQDASLAKQIAAAEGNAAVQAGILLGAANKAAAAFKKQEVSTAAIVRNLSLAGATTNKMGAIVPGKGGKRGAAGYIPGVAGEMHDIRRGVGGVSSSARPVHIPNFAFGGGQHGSMIANTGEHIVPNFRGGGSAVFNPAMVRANGGLPQGAKKITAAQGYVPNFAPIKIPGVGSFSPAQMPHQIQSGNVTAGAARAAGYRTTAEKKQAGRAGMLPPISAAGRGGLGIGVIAGISTRGLIQQASSKLGTLKGGSIKNAGLQKYAAANPNSTFTLAGIPVAGVNTLKTNPNAKQLEGDFSQTLNKRMVPALGNYAGDMFGSLFKDDGVGFVNKLKRTRGRIFSSSAEGAIFESALKLASNDAKAFHGDEGARFDFEEGGSMDSRLRRTFFKGQSVTRADAKRRDTPEQIRSLIPKAFGDPFTARKISARLGLRGAYGFVPNFAGGGLGAAIGREKAAGIPSSAIRVNSSPRFQSPSNPAGLAVTNQIDEPRGLRDVPNFAAMPTVNLASIFGSKKGLINTPAAFTSLNAAANKLAMQLAKETMTQGQVDRTLRKLQVKYGLNDAAISEFSASIKSTSTKIKNVGTKAAAAPVAGKGGGAGMGVGLGAMMLAPMIGGAAEQAVGGPMGGAISGGLTGAAMGGMMGSMFAPNPILGAAVGAGVGGVVGGVAGFTGSIETATEVLTNFTTTMQNNLTGAQAYMVAQKKVVTSVDEADFEKAAMAASDALYSIDDPVLRRKIQEAGNEFGKLTDVIRDYRHEQEKELKVKRTLAIAEANVDKNFTESGVFTRESATQEERALQYKIEATRMLEPLASYLVGEGKVKGKTLEQTILQARMIESAIAEAYIQPGPAGGVKRFTEGKVDEAKMAEGLRGAGLDISASDQIAHFLGSTMDKFWKEFFSVGTATESEADVRLMFANFLASTVGRVGKDMDDAAKLALANRKDLANFTQSLSSMYKQIDDAIVGRADIARRMGTNLARRTQRLGARGSMLGKAMDPMDLARERRTEGMANIEAKRGLLSGGVITSFGPKLGSLLEKIAASAQEELEGFGESIMAPFMKGNFADAMKALDAQRSRKITADGVESPRLNTKQMKLVVDFNRSLREGIAKGDEGIRKQELLLKDKFREDQVRAEILKAERDIQLQKTDYINKLELALATEEAVVSGRLTALSLTESDPRLTRFKGPVAKQKFAGDIATERLAIQQGLATDKLELEIETERAAIIAQHLLNTSTQKLTTSNFSLMAVLKLHIAAITKPEDQITTRDFPLPVILPSGTVMPKRRIRSRATEDLTGVPSEKNPYLAISERNAFNLIKEPPPKSGTVMPKRRIRSRATEDSNAQLLGAKPEITGNRTPDANLKSAIRKLKDKEEQEKRITDSVAGKGGTMSKGAREEAVLKLQEVKAEVIVLRKKVKEGTDEVILAEGVAGKGNAAPAIQQTAQTVKVEQEIVGYKETQYELAKILAAETSKESIDLANKALQEGKITEEMHFQLITAEKIAEKRRGILGTSQAQARADLNTQNRFKSGLAESETKFTEGLKDGMGAVFTESEGLMNRLGKSLPMTFRDNMVSAMEDVMDKTKDFDDALRGVAISFLKEMRRAFLQQGVSSLMNAVTAGTVSGSAAQMRPRTPGFQSGSSVPGSGTGDIVPAMLEPGEYVVNRKAAENNMPLLNSLNFGAYPRFGAQAGGLTPNEFRYTDRASELFSSPANVWDLGLGFTVPRSGRKSKPRKDIKRAFKSGKISSRQAFQFKKGFGLLEGLWVTGKAGADISFPRTGAQGNLPRDAKKAFAKGIINSQEYRTIRQIHGFQSGGAATLDAQLGSTLAGHRKKGGADASGFLWMNSNPQMQENAQDVSEAVQKRLQKAQEKENLKKQFMGMLISAGIGQAMGKIGDFVSSKTTMDINMNELSQGQKLELFGGLDEDAFAQKHGFGSMKAMMSPQHGAGYFKKSRWSKLGSAIRDQRAGSDAKRSYGTGGGGQRGGFVSPQGFQAGGPVGRYGVRGFQGGGSVSVNPLSSSSNVNNINITVNAGGGDSPTGGENQSRSVVGSSDEGSQAKDLSEKIKTRVLAVISEEQRVGGLLSSARRKP